MIQFGTCVREFLRPKRRSLLLTLLSLLLLVAHMVMFTWMDGWANSQFACDEDVWLGNALKAWEAGRGHSIAHVPLYCDLVTTFIVPFGLETGFKIWRFLLFFSGGVFMLAALARHVRLAVAFPLALHFILLTTPYQGGTYSYVATLFVLAYLHFVARRQTTGAALGVLFLGSLVRFELFVMFALAAAVTAVARTSLLRSASFWKQAGCALAVFVALLIWHRAAPSQLKDKFLARGGTAVKHFMVDTLYQDGRFERFGVTRGQVTPEFMDEVFREVFGHPMSELKEFSLPYLYSLNPDFVEHHYRRVFSEASGMLGDTYRVILPRPGSTWRGEVSNRSALIPPLLAGVLLAAVAGKFLWPTQRRQKAPVDGPGVSFIAYLLIPYSGFLAWCMTFPFPYYTIIASPTSYIAIGMLLERTVALLERSILNRHNLSPQHHG